MMRRQSYIVLLTVVFVVHSACDTTVDRFSEGDGESFFDLTGFLQTEADTQFVRVQSIRTALEPSPAASLEARVSIIDLTTREEFVMRDSLIRLDSGNTGHLFFALMRVEPGRMYELRAEDGLGRTTVATTLVPERPVFSFLPATTVGSTTTQFVSWGGISRTPDQAAAVYNISRDSTEPARAAEVPYTLRGRLVQNGWVAELRLSDDLRILRQQIGIPPDASEAVFFGMAMSIRIPSLEWIDARNGENIKDGTGFFGAIGVFTEEWLLGVEVVETLGFVNGQRL